MMWLMNVTGRLDLLFMKMTLRISMVLNWITGWEPRKFFPVVWGLLIFCLTEDIHDSASISNYVITIIVALFIIGMEYLIKFILTISPDKVMEYSFSRVWWFLWMLLMSPNILYNPFLYVGFMCICYAKYCYLHNLPPRDSVFARAGKKIREKLQSFSLAPSPA